MDPNKKQPSYSVDYLNQIAVKPQKKFQFSKTQKLVFGGVGLVLLIIVIVSLINLMNRPNLDLERLAARLQSTETTVGDSQDKLKDTDLRSQNSSLKIYLASANKDIGPILSKQHINANKLDSKIVEQESGDAMSARLEDARLNAIFDRTYAREMAYQLETTITLARKIHDSSSSSSLKDFLNTVLNSLVPVQQYLSDFQGTSS